MKQKEISKLKRAINLTNDRLTVENIYIGVISNTEIKYFKKERFLNLDNNEQTVYFKHLKDALGGKVGKSIIEYPVPVESFKNDSGIEKLLNVRNGNDDDEYIKETMYRLYESSTYTYPICILIANLKYDVPAKNKDVMDVDKDFGDSGEIFDFVICNIVPLTFAEAEVYYNEKEETLGKREADKSCLILDKKATDAIVYPVLNDDETDVNYVLYKTSTPKTPNTNIIESFLNCEYTMSGVDEELGIVSAIYGTFGDEVDYGTIIDMKKALKHIENQNEKEENCEIPQLDCQEFGEIIQEIGFSEDVAHRFETKYREALGDESTVKTVNAMNLENTVLKTTGVKVNVKQDHIDKIAIKKVDGVNSIVIEIEEGLTMDDILIKV